MNNLILFGLVVCVLMALCLLALALDYADVHPLAAVADRCRAGWDLAAEWCRAQFLADRSQDWTSAELAGARVLTLAERIGSRHQRTVPVAEILGHPIDLPYAPGAHLFGAHHQRAPFGVVTGNYAQTSRWEETTGALPTDAMAELLAEAVSSNA